MPPGLNLRLADWQIRLHVEAGRRQAVGLGSGPERVELLQFLGSDLLERRRNRPLLDIDLLAGQVFEDIQRPFDVTRPEVRFQKLKQRLDGLLVSEAIKDFGRTGPPSSWMVVIC